jgi:hypothetical protein
MVRMNGMGDKYQKYLNSLLNIILIIGQIPMVIIYPAHQAIGQSA